MVGMQYVNEYIESSTTKMNDWSWVTIENRQWLNQPSLFINIAAQIERDKGQYFYSLVIKQVRLIGYFSTADKKLLQAVNISKIYINVV